MHLQVMGVILLTIIVLQKCYVRSNSKDLTGAHVIFESSWPSTQVAYCWHMNDQISFPATKQICKGIANYCFY